MAGEGVLGLRRAFQIAGARTVIMSLWSVDDRATRTWMRALYEGRLSKGLNTADAVRAASLTVLQRPTGARREHTPLLLGRLCCGRRLALTVLAARPATLISFGGRDEREARPDRGLRVWRPKRL